MLHTPEQIYRTFLNAKKDFTGKSVKIPQDGIKTTPKNVDIIERVTDFFNTKWHNIDPYQYFLKGFELYKTFNYDKFFKEDIVRNYIQSKHNERLNDFNKHLFDKSVEYVKVLLEVENLTEEHLEYYFTLSDGYEQIYLKDYLKGFIDKYFVVYLLEKIKRYDIQMYKNHFNEDMKGYLTLIVENYDIYRRKLLDVGLI